MKKVFLQTFGCRVNQYETQAIREQFLNSGGYEETGEPEEANVFVLNTCTVTAESDRSCRYSIRKFHRQNPNGTIVVTGCCVERNRSEIEAFEGVTLAVSNREKPELFNLYEVGARHAVPLPIKKTQFPPLSISRFEGRARAYVKIQDGCSHACSFCKVVIARGRSRSRSLEDVVSEASRLAGEGYPEIVLTGIQLGAYGKDFPEPCSLVNVIGALSKIASLRRIRLSSIEPADVTESLIETMAQNEKCCPHLHLPLQSGDDGVLTRMNRRYVSAFYLDLIGKLRRRIPEFVLTTDAIVGFPGESDAQFERTFSVLSEAEPFHIHIFPFSPREGTRAARFTDRVSPKTVKERMKALQELDQKLRAKVENRFLGKTAEVIVEEGEKNPGWAEGRMSHYLKVRFPYAGKAGDACNVKICSRDGESLVGKISATPVRIPK